ncbi:hypothetical protein Trydic_g17076 [Trypoxylus dichotomus]
MDDPMTLKEALSRPDKQEWQKAIEEEYESLLQNNTWEIDFPKEKSVIQINHSMGHWQGDLTEEIYMCPPEGFETENKVCRLKKAIYGLKQASRAWNQKLHKVLIETGLKCGKTDPCV